MGSRLNPANGTEQPNAAARVGFVAFIILVEQMSGARMSSVVRDLKRKECFVHLTSLFLGDTIANRDRDGS
jgi:hypothetical protein